MRTTQQEIQQKIDDIHAMQVNGWMMTHRMGLLVRFGPRGAQLYTATGQVLSYWQTKNDLYRTLVTVENVLLRMFGGAPEWKPDR